MRKHQFTYFFSGREGPEGAGHQTLALKEQSQNWPIDPLPLIPKWLCQDLSKLRVNVGLQLHFKCNFAQQVFDLSADTGSSDR